jgi:hypothetical protein
VIAVVAVLGDWVDMLLGVLDSVMLWDTHIASLLSKLFQCLILLYVSNALLIFS